MAASRLPEDPLGRFLALARAVAGRRKWYQDQTTLYYAACGAVTVEGHPDELVALLWQRAEELYRGVGWTSPLRQNIRFVIAPALLRSGIETAAFLRQVEGAKPLFKSARLPQRDSSHALIAMLLCVQRARGGRIERSLVDRVASVYQGFRADHGFLTGADDLPAAALLATTDASANAVLSRVESMYRSLREAKFGAGNQLQRASQLLYFAPVGPTESAHRFRALWSAFRDAGLYMHQGDYDELALLCFFGRSPGELVRHVLEHRDAIRALRPRPSKDTAFSLACSTTFLQLAPKERALGDAHALLQIQSVLQAQHAAALAAASAGAAATTG